jgi:hypothetical protein
MPPDSVASGGRDPDGCGAMSGWYYGGLGILYLVLLFTVAIMTFRKGHWILGLIGFIFPILWLIGAILPPVRHR